MGNLCDPHPLAFEEGGHLELAYQVLVERGLVDDLLVLQATGQVDAVVLADVLHCLGRQEPGIRQNAHRIEDVTTALQVPAERSGRHAGEFCQLLLADEAVLVVVVNHFENWDLGFENWDLGFEN